MNEDLTILPIKQPIVEKKIKHHNNFFDVNGGACVLDIAAPRQGKTIRICNYFQNPNFLMGKLDAIYIYSSTITNGDATARFLLDQYGETIYSEYSDQHLQNIIDYQDQIPKAQRPNIAIVFAADVPSGIVGTGSGEPVKLYNPLPPISPCTVTL